jgi:hypothetical protein
MDVCQVWRELRHDRRVGLRECVGVCGVPIQVVHNEVLALVFVCFPSIKIWYTIGVLPKKIWWIIQQDILINSTS